MPRDWDVTGYLQLGHGRRPGVDGTWDIELNDFPEEDRQGRWVELPAPGIFPIKARVIEVEGRLFLAALIVELLPPPPPELEVLEGDGAMTSDVEAPRGESEEPWAQKL